MSSIGRGVTNVAAASLLGLAALVSPSVAQISVIQTSAQILSGQSTSGFSSTTAVQQDRMFFDPGRTSATMRIGFNVNADADSGPSPVAVEIGIVSFEMLFTLDHAASFDLVLDFGLFGQLLRLPGDQECQGSIALADISIPSLVRLRDGAEFPLNVTLPGGSRDGDSSSATFNFAEQDSRVIEMRGEPVETTAYRLSFLVSATAVSLSCAVSARFGADTAGTICSACVYPGFGERVRDDDGLFVTVTVSSLCGDVRLDEGEQCDFGPLNGAPESCCDAFCQFAPATTVCRPAAGECDRSEMCTGTSDGCPDDLAEPAGTPCTADRSACTDDVCNDAGACTHPLRPGTTCDAQNLCTCDDDGLFCTGPVRCPAEGGLCIQLPPPCGEDDTCDEEHDVCVSALGTVTPTATGTPPGIATPTAPPPPTATSTAVGATCAGDCNGDLRVAVNELVIGVNVALGNQPASACPAFDSDRSGDVAINELVAAVSNALAGCEI